MLHDKALASHFLKKILVYFYFICMGVVHGCFASVYVCVPHACSVSGCQKRALELLELELQVAVRHHVDAGN